MDDLMALLLKQKSGFIANCKESTKLINGLFVTSLKYAFSYMNLS